MTIYVLGKSQESSLASSRSNLTETNLAADISTSGTLTISDVDSAATFVAQAGTLGSYGTFAIDTAGAWAYTASDRENDVFGKRGDIGGCPMTKKKRTLTLVT